MDKNFILRLSKKANITLNDTEVDHMVRELTLFNEAMEELYTVDTSKFSNTEEFTNTLNFLELRNDN